MLATIKKISLGNWRLRLLVLILGITLIAGFVYFTLRKDMGPKDAIVNRLDRLHAACVQDMVASTCAVMNTGASAPSAKPGDVVFVAGVGQVDAKAYEQIYAAGDAMCSVVRDACARDWGSTQCLTARKLLKAAQLP
jgi:hypothetical protein